MLSFGVTILLFMLQPAWSFYKQRDSFTSYQPPPTQTAGYLASHSPNQPPPVYSYFQPQYAQQLSLQQSPAKNMFPRNQPTQQQHHQQNAPLRNFQNNQHVKQNKNHPSQPFQQSKNPPNRPPQVDQQSIKSPVTAYLTSTQKPVPLTEDICVGSPCGLHATCSPEEDRVTCTCTSGFTGQPPDFPCEPFDFCSRSAGHCGANTTCVNILAGLVCQCIPGHFSMNITVYSCLPADEDECESNEMLCGYNAHCDNTHGSYVCTCEDGYTGDPPSTSCRDINECTYQEDVCGEHAQCTNTLGSFTCSCIEGYEGDPPVKSCFKMNYCGENICGENASCVETLTGYHCACTPGHTGNDTAGCVPGVERSCTLDQDCTKNAACYTCCGGTGGTCHCLQGFVQHVSECQDIDECSLGISTCGQYTDCHNFQGGYNCTCSQGYQGQPPELPCTILRLNECQQGYQGNPPDTPCLDIDECSDPVNVCGEDAKCLNTVGSYSCQCKEGFTGNPPVQKCTQKSSKNYWATLTHSYVY